MNPTTPINAKVKERLERLGPGAAHAGEANIWIGGLAGYAASRAMDAATSRFYDHQSDRSKRREEELAPGGTLVQIGMQLAQAVGREVDREQGGKIGLTVHRALGIAYGMIASALIRRGLPPARAGLAVGTAAFVLIDEGTAIAQVTDYPVESHLRGVVGHGTLGLASGALLSLVSRR